MNNLAYQYHISGAVKSAVAYVLDGSVDGVSSNTVNGANSNTANLTLSSSVPKVLYSETLYYEDCDSEGCTPQYNGNISRMVHHLAHINQFFSTERDVAYYYDELNRLTKVDDKNERDFYDEAFTYDAQGRITSQRRDGYINNATGGEYNYYAQSNRLEKVSAGMSNDVDFNRNMTSNENFIYDRDGNMIEDKSKQMTISYDHRGLPVEFKRESSSSENGADSVRLVLNYDGAGSRISKIRERKSASETEWTTELTTHYTGIGSEIREDAINNATKVVVNLPQGLGRYDIASASEPSASSVPSFEWYLKNHLGSTMLVYGINGNDGSLKAAYDYRAFGEQVDLTWPTNKVTETFTGKEKDDETELSYFGARYLDQMLGLWVSVDAKRQHYSPYEYGSNSPINVFDPDGNEDIYFLLGGTLNRGSSSITMSQYKRETALSANAFKDKGYSVKYIHLTQKNFNQAIKDPEIKRAYSISHVNESDGRLKSYKEREGWLGSDDIGTNKDLDFSAAGCKSQGLVENQWSGNFNDVTGLNAERIMSTDALIDLDRAAQIDAITMPMKENGNE